MRGEGGLVGSWGGGGVGGEEDKERVESVRFIEDIPASPNHRHVDK